MKRPTKKKSARRQAAKPETSAQPATPAVVNSSGPCPPDIVFREAMAEENRRALREYHDAIKVLRDEKRFTFREIAEWLEKYNVEADHNAVYREYTRGMPESIAGEEAIADDHMEREDAGC